jgi:hypothetical protein
MTTPAYGAPPMTTPAYGAPSMTTTHPHGAAPPVAKSSRSTIIVIALLVVLAIGAGLAFVLRG